MHPSNTLFRSHKRDDFIDFIKSLLLTPFVLHSRPQSLSELNLLSDGPRVPAVNNSEDVALTQEEQLETNEKRYLEIMKCIEDLVNDHLFLCNRGQPNASRLSKLVPSIGRFFTPLPLQQSFLINNKERAIASRRFVPPSFNDVRHILNTAQLMAIAPTVKLITFDGDQTLYEDGHDFHHESELVLKLIELLRTGMYVAIVTAAGYPNDPRKYEQRLSGLLAGFQKHNLSEEHVRRFFVLGGECNYLFRLCPKTCQLIIVPESDYPTPKWTSNPSQINSLLDVAEHHLQSVLQEMGLTPRTKILRKSRALGVIPVQEHTLTREQLNEICLSVQSKLNTIQDRKSLQNPSYTPLPFCSFNGGNDMWLDIGNKMIGIDILQQYLHCKSNETLHVGDQFLRTGNDVATRGICCTAWITSPEETFELLSELMPLIGERDVNVVNNTD